MNADLLQRLNENDGDIEEWAWWQNVANGGV